MAARSVTCPASRGRLDRGTTGGRWELGWYPTTLGVLVDRSVSGRHGHRSPGHAAGNRGAAGLCAGRRERVAVSSLYVAGLGYRLGTPGPAPLRYGSRPPKHTTCSPMDPARADLHRRRLAGALWHCAVRWLGIRIRE